jgi:hypothetical protein
MPCNGCRNSFCCALHLTYACHYVHSLQGVEEDGPKLGFQLCPARCTARVNCQYARTQLTRAAWVDYPRRPQSAGKPLQIDMHLAIRYGTSCRAACSDCSMPTLACLCDMTHAHDNRRCVSSASILKRVGNMNILFVVFEGHALYFALYSDIIHDHVIHTYLYSAGVMYGTWRCIRTERSQSLRLIRTNRGRRAAAAVPSNQKKRTSKVKDRGNKKRARLPSRRTATMAL